MVQPRDRVGFAVEPTPDVLARVQMRMQHLDRDRAPQLRVPATPDHGHAALADLLVEAVPPQLQTFLPATPMSRLRVACRRAAYSKA